MSARALIIERDACNCDQLCRLIEQQGFEPLQARTGHEGLDLAQGHLPDLLLVNLDLPDLAGSAVCEACKLEHATNLIPLVMITPSDEYDDLESGVRVVADAYVPQPRIPHDLESAVGAALRWREQALASGRASEVRFDIRSEIKHLKEVHRILLQLLLRTTLTEKEIREVGQALLEMGMNAVEWGNRNRPEALVKIIYRVDAEKTTLTVRDSGPGFNPQALPHAAHDADPVAHMLVRENLGLREGGFGIMLTRGMVDKLEYNDAGNEVMLTKYFNGVSHGR